MAGGEIFSLRGLLLTLFGVTYHAIGFLDNNVVDYEYDKGDPAKRHFPLVTGEVSLYTADFIVKQGLVALVLFGILLAGPNAPALIPLTVGIISGLIYNRYNKRHYWKGVPISVCFAMIPLFSYLAVGSNPTPLTWLLVAYVFLQVYYQITVSGELKEIEASSEKSILRALGVKVTPTTIEGTVPWFHTSPIFYAYAYTLKISNILVALFIAYQNTDERILTLSAFIAGVTLYRCRRLLRGGRWDRKAKLQEMALVEIVSYYLIVVAVYPGFWETAFLVVAPTLWFFLLNRVMWGREHLIGPRV